MAVESIGHSKGSPRFRPGNGLRMLRIYVGNQKGRAHFEHSQGPIELGRGPRAGAPRVVIDDDFVSTNQLRVEETAPGRINLENLSKGVGAELTGGSRLEPGAVRELGLPVRITVGTTLIEIEQAAPAEDVDPATLRSIADPVLAPAPNQASTATRLPEAPTVEQLSRWFETLVAVQQSAASSPDFHRETARAIVDLIGLDCGLVILRDQEGWRVAASHGQNPSAGAEFSRSILERVSEERRTFYQVIEDRTPSRSQLAGSSVVAAPIFSAEGGPVIGAVYGVRASGPDRSGQAIRPLEAQLVQVLAGAVTAGLARLESEKLAARRLRQFSDFFSPELAAELERNPAMLDGERREVTVLFADVRGFSTISERLSPEETCALARDVMEQLTRRIRELQGVVVNYQGDGLHALWNAPLDQPDHASLACRAALAMVEELHGLNQRWGARIGGPVRLGIGVNTGPALVGNTGSESRFQYGPQGHTVNLASRVEGATKHLGVPILITGSTHTALGLNSFACRKLCQVQVIGIDEHVVLHELHALALNPAWQAWRDTYEMGLRQFEACELSEACRTLHALLEGQAGKYDLPTLTLLGRAIEHLKDPARPFSPVFTLGSK